MDPFLLWLLIGLLVVAFLVLVLVKPVLKESTWKGSYGWRKAIFRKENGIAKTDNQDSSYFHPRCHPTSLTRTAINHETSTLTVECAECKEVIFSAKVEIPTDCPQHPVDRG